MFLTSSLFALLAIVAELVTGEAPYRGLDKYADEYMLPELEYGYGDLEPYIDELTLYIHHGGHHLGYSNRINGKLKQWRQETSDGFASQAIIDILADIDNVPEEYRKDVRDFGGGFVNHAIYFAVMSKNEANITRLPTGPLLEEINKAFGSFDSFKEQFTTEAIRLFGSGYVWLSQRPSLDGTLNLVITTTSNQDSPLADGLDPILTLDVWEHAYYLKHQLRRNNHVEDWWRVVDWDQVGKLSDWWQQTSGEHDEL